MRHELTMHVGGNLVSLLDGERRIDGDVQLSQQLMPEPARAYFLHLAHAGDMGCRVLHFGEHVRLDTIERAADDFFRRAPSRVSHAW